MKLLFSKADRYKEVLSFELNLLLTESVTRSKCQDGFCLKHLPIDFTSGTTKFVLRLLKGKTYNGHIPLLDTQSILFVFPLLHHALIIFICLYHSPYYDCI